MCLIPSLFSKMYKTKGPLHYFATAHEHPHSDCTEYNNDAACDSRVGKSTGKCLAERSGNIIRVCVVGGGIPSDDGRVRRTIIAVALFPRRAPGQCDGGETGSFTAHRTLIKTQSLAYIYIILSAEWYFVEKRAPSGRICTVDTRQCSAPVTLLPDPLFHIYVSKRNNYTYIIE